MPILPLPLRKGFAEHIVDAGLFCQYPQYIKAHNVAGAFPDTVYRHLTIQARQLTLLAIANPAQHFHRFSHKRHTDLANGEFRCWREQPGPQRLFGISTTVPGPRQSKQ